MISQGYIVLLLVCICNITLNSQPSFENVNSWAYRDWKLDSDEDDFCLVPGVMRHCIESQQSKKKNRITLVINVDIKK